MFDDSTFLSTNYVPAFSLLLTRLLKNILEETISDNRIDYYAQLNNLNFNGRVKVYVLGDEGKRDFYLYKYIIRKIGHLLSATSFFIFDGFIVAIVFLDQANISEEEISNKFMQITKDNELFAGCSYTFCGINKLKYYYSQARYAYSQCAIEDATMMEYRNCMTKHITVSNIDDVKALEAAILPEVHALEEYDSVNNTKLLETLETYIKNSQSMKKTAQDLNIHINTLKYRLSVIDTITKLDLTDYNMRFSIQLCLYIRNVLND